MRFINTHTHKLLFHIGSHDEAITEVAVSPNGQHIAAITDRGGINIYSIQSLTQELNKVNDRALTVILVSESICQPCNELPTCPE